MKPVTLLLLLLLLRRTHVIPAATGDVTTNTKAGGLEPYSVASEEHA
jgi:hypothetical protein